MDFDIKDLGILLEWVRDERDKGNNEKADKILHVYMGMVIIRYDIYKKTLH